MRDCTIILKDGRKFCGPLWEFHPSDGWLSIVSEDGNGIVKFIDAESITIETRTHPGVVKTVDLLERALAEGWDGT